MLKRNAIHVGMALLALACTTETTTYVEGDEPSQGGGSGRDDTNGRGEGARIGGSDSGTSNDSAALGGANNGGASHDSSPSTRGAESNSGPAGGASSAGSSQSSSSDGTGGTPMASAANGAGGSGGSSESRSTSGCTEGTRSCIDAQTPGHCDSHSSIVSEANCSSDTTCLEGRCVCHGSPSCTNNVARSCVNGNWKTEDCVLGCDGAECRVNTNRIAGKIACDLEHNLYCVTPSQVCNFGTNASTTALQYSCGAAAAGTTSIACDGPGDCGTGQVCCKGAYVLCNSYCAAAGTCGAKACYNSHPDRQLCDPLAPDCPSGLACTGEATWTSARAISPLSTCE